MFETPAPQKAYELSYATFRVAALVRKPDLKERLERQAAAILEKAASGEFDIHDHLEALRALIMLSEGVGEIRYVNAKVLLRELGNLERMVKDRLAKGEGLPGQGGEDGFDIERMFSTIATGKAGVEDSIRRIQERREAEEHAHPAGNSAKQEEKSVAELPNRQNAHPSPIGFGGQGNGSTPSTSSGQAKLTTSGNGEAHPTPNGFGGQARASAIYAKIQLGNASIKDLLAEFGTVSERTLRYDLQRLVEQGKIERVGSGGPGTYYRLPVGNPLLATPSQPLISETTIH